LKKASLQSEAEDGVWDKDNGVTEHLWNDFAKYRMKQPRMLSFLFAGQQPPLINTTTRLQHKCFHFTVCDDGIST
jgi:hypothetical protein